MRDPLSQRRPIWRPGAMSRLRSYCRGLLSRITLQRAVVIVVGAPILLYIVRDLFRDSLVIDPFSVPKQFEEAGLKPEVIADRIGDALRAIETETHTSTKKDSLAALREDRASPPDIDIPGTKLGIKTLTELIRTVFGIYVRHVSGDIVIPTPSIAAPATVYAKVTVYVTRGRERIRSEPVTVPANDIESLARRAAEVVLDNVNPYVLAVLRYDQGNLDAAAAIAERIIRDESMDRAHVAAAHNLSGNVLEKRQMYDEAIHRYQQALQIDPRFALAYNNWGYVLQKQGKLDEAVVKYQKAAEFDPKLTLAYNNWGALLYSQLKYDAAMAKFRKATEVDPKFAPSYYNLGNVLEELSRYEDAIAMYRKATDLDPAFLPAYQDWRQTLQKLGRSSEDVEKLAKERGLAIPR